MTAVYFKLPNSVKLTYFNTGMDKCNTGFSVRFVEIQCELDKDINFVNKFGFLFAKECTLLKGNNVPPRHTRMFLFKLK